MGKYSKYKQSLTQDTAPKKESKYSKYKAGYVIPKPKATVETSPELKQRNEAMIKQKKAVSEYNKRKDDALKYAYEKELPRVYSVQGIENIKAEDEAKRKRGSELLKQAYDKKATREFENRLKTDPILNKFKKISDVVEPVAAFSGGLGGNIGELIDTDIRETRKYLEAKYPKTATAGNIAGYIAPVGKLTKVAQPLRSAIGGTKGLLATEALIGGVTDAAIGAARGEDVVKKFGEGALYGGVGAGVFAGARKGIRELSKARYGSKVRGVDEALERAYQGLDIGGKTSAKLPNIPKTPKSMRKPIAEAIENMRDYTRPQQVTPSRFSPEQVARDMPVSTREPDMLTRLTQAPEVDVPTRATETAPVQEISQVRASTDSPVQKRINFNNIKTVNDLPNSVEELEVFISETKKQIDKGFKVDLQLFAEAEKKLVKIKRSKFRTNTIKRAEDIPEDIKKYELNAEEFDYIVEKSDDWQRKAMENIDNDIDGVINKIENSESISGGVQAHEAAVVTKKLLDDATKTGDYSRFKNFVKTVASKTRETARGLKGTDTAWKKSPAGAIQKATREVDNFNDKVLKQNPNVRKKVKDATKKAKETMKKAKKERDKTIDYTVNNFKQKETGQRTNFPALLKNKIVKELNPQTPRDIGFIRRMLKDLFNESAENIKYPTKPKGVDKSIEDLAGSVKYRGYRKNIKQEAMKLLKDQMSNDTDFARMLADNPSLMRDIENYFKTGNISQASKKLMDSVINKRLKGNQLKEWVKDFYASGRASREDFIDSIVKETGLTGEDARRLQKQLYANLKNRTKEVKDNLLSSIMKPREIKKLTKSTEKLTELTNIGLLENKKFVNRVGEKISPLVKRLLKENDLSLDEIVRLTATEQRKEVGKILKDVFKNTRVDDTEINKLLNVIRDEFEKLSEKKKSSILQRMAGLDAEGNVIQRGTQKGDLDKLIEKINLGLYDDSTDALIREMILEKNGLPQLKDDDIKFIFDTMKSIEGLDEYGEKYLEGIAKVQKLINDKTPATFGQKVRSIGFQSMLGNLSSQVVNIGGNILNVGGDVALNPLKRGIDVALGGQRVTGKIDKKEFAKGMKKGLRSVKRDMLGGKDFKDFKNFKELWEGLANPIDASPTNIRRDKFEQGKRLAFDNNPLRVTENIVSSALSAGDRPFEQAFYDTTLKQLMKSQGVDVATDEIRETAKQIAQNVTFKGDNFISTILTTLKDLPKFTQQRLGIKPEALRGLAKVGWSIPEIASNTLLPFVKTPANIVKRTLEYSPVGLMEGTLKLLANRKGMSLAQKRDVVDVLSRGMLGSGMMGLGFGLGKQGLITGDRPDNYRAYKQSKESGYLPNAIKIGDTYVDLKKFYPFTAPIVSGALLAEGEVGKGGKSYLESSAATINNLTDMSLLQTLVKAAEIMNPTSHKDKTKILIDLAMQLPNQLTPSLIKKITHWSDDYERNLTSDNLLEHAYNNYVGRLPGVSEKYPENVDWKGNPIERYGGKNTLLNVMSNPYKVTKEKEDPIAQESLRLYDYSGESSTLLPRASDTKTLGRNKAAGFEGFDLTIREQNQYQKFIGQELEKNLGELLKSKEYQNMNDDEKKEIFEDYISTGRRIAKEMMLEYLFKTRVKPNEN